MKFPPKTMLPDPPKVSVLVPPTPVDPPVMLAAKVSVLPLLLVME